MKAVDVRHEESRDAACVRSVVVAAFTGAAPESANPGPAEPGPAERGPAEPGPANPGPAEPGPAEPGPVEPGPVEPGPGAAAAEPVEARLLDSLRADPASVTTGWVIEVDGDVVGHLLVVPVTVGGAPASAIGMVAVAPEHQKKGYGAELVNAALGELIQTGETLVVVLGSPAYYGRFGFVPAPVVGVESPLYPSPYMQALPLRVAHPRGEIVYPRPYRDLEG